MAAESSIVATILGVGILLLASKLMAELFLRFQMPMVLGELVAGIIIGPFALGAYLIGPDGTSLVTLTPEIRTLGEIGAIVILFMAGLEMTPKEFIRGGKASFTVGTLGVVVPFFVGLFIFQEFGFDTYQAMLIATALTATSIAISIQVLNEFGKLKTPEARLIIGAAVVDDILAIAVLSVVTSIGGNGGDMSTIAPVDVIINILWVLGFFAGMMLVAAVVLPRIMNSRLWKGKGSIEAIATASFFGAAALAGTFGLSPIVGAFAVGMALSTARVFKRVEHFTDKIGLIFAPLFFVIIGAQVDLRSVDLHILALSGVVIVIAVLTKLLGCGVPAMLFLKSRARGLRVGIGMISRGEVGLIVAGVGVAAGSLSNTTYSTIILMVAVTTVITPLWLKAEYRRESKNANKESSSAITKDTSQ